MDDYLAIMVYDNYDVLRIVIFKVLAEYLPEQRFNSREIVLGLRFMCKAIARIVNPLAFKHVSISRSL